MAKHWYIETDASTKEIVAAFNKVFFTRPSIGTRMKVWSKAAQLQSNLRWESTGAQGADAAAVMVSGGVREMAASSRHGPGSGLGTTVALAVRVESGATQAELWLAQHNTFAGMNQQGDVIRSYTKQVAAELTALGRSARVHK